MAREDNKWSRWLADRSDDDLRQLIKDAFDYQSSEDSCNAIYMGGAATESAYKILGIPFPNWGSNAKPRDQYINEADRCTLDESLEVVGPFIETMMNYPTKRCPCCGQITSA